MLTLIMLGIQKIKMITHGKQRLPRPCEKCHERFIPSGRDQRKCEKCQRKAIIKAQKNGKRTRKNKIAFINKLPGKRKNSIK